MFKLIKKFKTLNLQLKAVSKELTLNQSLSRPRKRKAAVIKWLIKAAGKKDSSWMVLLDKLHSQTLALGLNNSQYQCWLQFASDSEALKQELAINQCIISLAPENSLNPYALQRVAAVFQSQPQVCVIYTDHDYLDENNQRVNPVFKPDWNLDFFLSFNYLSCAVFLRQEWVVRIFKDSSNVDYNKLVSLLVSLNPVSIYHLPEVLVHLSSEDEAGILEEGIDNFKFKRLLNNVERVDKGLYEHSRHIIFALPKPTPLVSIIIPTRDHLSLVQTCVQSILDKTSYTLYEIIIVNNQSRELATLAWLEQVQKQHLNIKVVDYPYEFNYSAINNFAVKHAQGTIIGLLNNDIEVINSGWLEEMVRHASREDIGCVGAKLYYADGRIQHGGVILGSGNGRCGHAHRYFPSDADGYCGRLKLVQNFTAVTGACLLVRKELYERVGGLNEVDLPIAWSDIDLCLKIRALGYRNLWTPYAELYHHESISRGRDSTKEQIERYQLETAYMFKHWGDIIRNDPAYNPNLTVVREDFSLSLPIRNFHF